MRKPYVLRDSQVQTIKLLFKFRYATHHQLARHRDASIPVTFRILQRLIARGYVERSDYSNLDRIDRKRAYYYLSKRGIQYLRENYTANPSVLRSYYKNKALSESFVAHNLSIFDAYLSLRSLYEDTFDIFSKAELAIFDYFPDPLPDLYLHNKQDQGKSYMLCLFSDSPLWIIKKRVKAYTEHFDSGDWPDEEYPDVLLVCPDQRTEFKLQQYLEPLLEDFDFYTTTTKALLSEKLEKAIWSDPVEPEKLKCLNMK